MEGNTWENLGIFRDRISCKQNLLESKLFYYLVKENTQEYDSVNVVPVNLILG